jgi:lipoprotein-anchoring transpeptidase ErfK/SrfK
MTTARLTGGFYAAAMSAILIAFALSWRTPMGVEPRLEISWTLGSSAAAPPIRTAAAPPIRTAAAPTPQPRPQPRPQRAATARAPAPPATTPAHARSTPPPAPSGKTEVARVEERLKDNLTQELYDNFRLFLYVSKAASGPWAQQMYVFRKEANGDFTLLHRWPVSTGRERTESDAAGARVSTRTPAGYYEFDPDRFYRRHFSSEWHQPMPYAMFFNWRHRGRLTGLAIHSATGGDVALLGKRASAGCIHLSPEAARTLYTLIRRKYRGTVPRFAVSRAGTMSNEGIVLHDLYGKPRTAPGYKVLVFIENYGGRNVIAAMY